MILLILVSKLSYICCEITHTEKNVAKIDGKYQKGFFFVISVFKDLVYIAMSFTFFKGIDE